MGKPSPRASLSTTSVQPVYSTPNQPFEDVLLRQRTLGQDIIPSPREPKRTESLYTPTKPMTSSGSTAASSSGGGGHFGKSGKLKVCISIPVSIAIPNYFPMGIIHSKYPLCMHKYSIYRTQICKIHNGRIKNGQKFSEKCHEEH